MILLFKSPNNEKHKLHCTHHELTTLWFQKGQDQLRPQTRHLGLGPAATANHHIEPLGHLLLVLVQQLLIRKAV